MEFSVKLTSGWCGSIIASGIEEAKYNATKMARVLNERVIWVGRSKENV